MIGYWHYNHLVERDESPLVPRGEYPSPERYETVLCVRKVTVEIDERGLHAYYTEKGVDETSTFCPTSLHEVQHGEKTLVPFEQVYPKINYRATRYSSIE